MDRRERQDDPVEALRAALDGRQAEMWTTLPGIIESFDPEAMTCSVQLAVQGQVQDESVNTRAVNLPLLVDVPVVFPSGGGFTLTFPIKKGDECKVDFASRCIDGWWQNGGIGGLLDERMHDLSDGMATVGIRSQVRVLKPAVNTEGVQLRSDDGQAAITMLPDYTITAENPACSLSLGADGTITSKAKAAIVQEGPALLLKADSITMTSLSGGASDAKISGKLAVDELTSGGVAFNPHYHECACGKTSGPKQ